MTATLFIAATLAGVAAARFAPDLIARAWLAVLERGDVRVCAWSNVTDQDGGAA